MKINKEWLGFKTLLLGVAIAFIGLFFHEERGDAGYAIGVIGIFIGIVGGLLHAKEAFTEK